MELTSTKKRFAVARLDDFGIVRVKNSDCVLPLDDPSPKGQATIRTSVSVRLVSSPRFELGWVSPEEFKSSASACSSQPLNIGLR